MYNIIRTAGANNNKNVFKIVFNTEPSSLPRLEAWDNENYNTTNKIFFSGSKPLILAVDTDNFVEEWWTKDAHRLKGDENYLEFNEIKKVYKFNIAIEIPKNLGIFSDFVTLRIVYSYEGKEPRVVWYYNKGTESSPEWDYIRFNKKIMWNDRNISKIIVNPYLTRYAEEISVEI